MENRIVKMKAGAITTLSGLNDNKGRDRTWSEVDLLTDRSAPLFDGQTPQTC